jgi:phosphoglycolate phosphatase-like HAD superfamily hydrolase
VLGRQKWWPNRRTQNVARASSSMLPDFAADVASTRQHLCWQAPIMLIIFDVDGTLIGGESHDWDCFDQAIEAVVGFAPTQEFLSSLPEITAQAIAEASLRAANKEPGSGLEERIRDEYLRRLRQVHSRDPRAFPARNGVMALLSHLSSLRDVAVAIATGDWHATATFKLAAAGIDVSCYPMATSSDVPRRSEIIRLAAQRARQSLSDVVYVGDGIWDLRACRDLGVSFVGTGSRLGLLRQAGVQHVIEVLEAALFLSTVRAAIGSSCRMRQDNNLRQGTLLDYRI